jgi:O-antigen biosynthesis protein WbqP
MRIDTPQNTPTHLLDSPEKWITKVGKILRKTSIDELPQLINILKGDMSFIGPRPALWNQYDLIGERQKLGVNILYPGLTGYAQIHGRDSISIHEKVLLDDFYAKHISFFLDLKIFILTFGKILKSDGVVEGSNLPKEKQAETLELTDDSK